MLKEFQRQVSDLICRKMSKEKNDKRSRNRLNKKVSSNVTFIEHPECKIAWSPFAPNVNGNKFYCTYEL